MKEKILNFIVCPECKKTLKFFDFAHGNIEGVLHCVNAHIYPVARGVPVLLLNDHLGEFLEDGEKKSFSLICEKLEVRLGSEKSENPEMKLLKKTSDNWAFHWSLYDNEQTLWEDKETFYEHIPLEREEIGEDAVVLEVGCGRGRNIMHIRNRTNLVFAIDVSSSAYFASKRYEQANNVFVLRADAARMPFKDGFFDIVLSDHVLQHVYDLKSCFDEVRRVSKKKNRFLFNLYSRENNALMIYLVEPLKKMGLGKLSVQTIHFLAYFPAILLYASLRLVYFPLYRKAPRLYKALPLSQHMIFWLNFNFKLLWQSCFDLLHAPRVRYFSGNDIQKISEEKNFYLKKQYLLRQTLWICDGCFDKSQGIPAQNPAR